MEHIPQKYIDSLPLSARNMFVQWRDFLYNRVKFNRPESVIHAAPHCERVLYHALNIGHAIFGDNQRILTALAHAAVFHDTRRLDDYLDTGHGARAAIYYRDFCTGNGDLEYIQEAALMMKYHDISDKRGKDGIEKEYRGTLPTMFELYDIFKDADALDRWRLGIYGLDTRFLRTSPAKEMVDLSRKLVEDTMSHDLRLWIADKVEQTLNKNKLLMVVDPQVDFIIGTLPVPGAREAMESLAKYIESNGSSYLHKIVTADRHPYNHCSFKSEGGQWPRHCVHDSPGAAVWQSLFDPLYSTSGDVTFLYKGQRADSEEYSIFKNPEARETIEAIVAEKHINHIDICGLAGDICVSATLADGREIFGDIFHLLPQYSPIIG